METALSRKLDLTGRKALITGASGGLGAHFASVLAEHGAKVVLAARRREKLEGVAKELNDTGRQAEVVEMDVTKPETVIAAFDAMSAQEDGPCDILINNSGVAAGTWGHETSDEDWGFVIDTNLTGAWHVSKTAVQAMIKANKPGSVVNIASILALHPSLQAGAYAASKAGIEQLTRVMSLELTRHNIRVNALAPGYFATDLNSEMIESDYGEKMRKRIPMRRFGDYSELDAALMMLASDAGSFMTGTTIVVDGGHTNLPL